MKRLLGVVWGILWASLAYAQVDSLAYYRVQELYSIYDDFLKSSPSRETDRIDSLRLICRSYVTNLDVVTGKTVIETIIDDVVASFDTKSNEDFLVDASRAVLILPDDNPYRFTILNLMADVYAYHENKALLLQTIEEMKKSPEAEFSENAAIITALQEKADALESFEDVLNGYWVADRSCLFGQREGYPIFVLNIFDDQEGKTALMTDYISTPDYEDDPISRYCNLFQYDELQRTFLSRFSDRRIRFGNAQLASSMIDSAQDAEAHFRALANDKRATLGQAMTSQLVGTALSLGFQVLANSVAVSSLHDDVIYVTGSYYSENILKVHLDYQQLSSNTGNMLVKSNVLFNNDMELLRWKEEYGIVYGKPDCSPVSPFVDKLSPDMELYRIKDRISVRRPEYWAPMVAGALAGIGLSVWGIKMLCEIPSRKKIEEDRGHSISTDYYDEMWRENGWNKKLLWGMGLVTTGGLGCMFSFIIPFNVRDARRAKAVREYNYTQTDLLRQYNSKE